MAPIYICFLLTLTLTFVSATPTHQWGRNNYTEYIPGNLNMIIVVPHGGQWKPASIPDRQDGCWTGQYCIYNHTCTGRSRANCKIGVYSDLWTWAIGEHLLRQVHQLTGKWPHLVRMHLHRRKMDANRDLPEATFYNPQAKAAFEDFHYFIDMAKKRIGGRGLLFDIHGQTHPEQMVELGYLLRSAELNSGNLNPRNTSIRHLAGEVGISFNALVHGNTSLGAYIQDGGYDAIPSPAHPRPGAAKFYSGGYNTKRHGSRDGGTIDAIQIESPKKVRNDEKGPKYTAALAKAIVTFMVEHYDLEVPTSSAVTLTFSTALLHCAVLWLVL